MKTIIFNTFSCIILCLGVMSANAQSKTDEATIKALVKEAYDGFSTKNAARFAAVFTEDADFTPPTGQALKGRTAIEAAHVQMFKTMDFKVQKTEFRTIDVRFLTPDIALCTWTEYQEAEWAGQPQKGDTIGACTAVRQNGQWRAAAVQLTPVMPSKG